jgi:myo-inositol 2-dehydrogenase/D-chiro-inositol 1-dehydrogenase
MEPFRIGLIGGGRMGQTHLRALATSDDVVVTCVVEPHPETAAKLREFGLHVHETVPDLLTVGGVDGVLIAAPTDRHLGLVEQVAQAGLPILCEKPCGLTAAQARAAGEAARRHAVVLQVAYWRRFIPALQDLRARITSGGMGAVHMTVCAQWDQAPPPTQFRSHSGGIFIDMGVHEIDQLRWLTGCEVTDVHAVAYPTLEDPDAVGDADSVQALLTMSDGGAALVSLGRFHPDGDMVAAEMFGSRDHVRIAVLDATDGEGPQLAALRRQAEAFARHTRGGAQEGAGIDDAEMALVVADRLSKAANLQLLGSEES